MLLVSFSYFCCHCCSYLCITKFRQSTIVQWKRCIIIKCDSRFRYVRMSVSVFERVTVCLVVRLVGYNTIFRTDLNRTWSKLLVLVFDYHTAMDFIFFSFGFFIRFPFAFCKYKNFWCTINTMAFRIWQSADHFTCSITVTVELDHKITMNKERKKNTL